MFKGARGYFKTWAIHSIALAIRSILVGMWKQLIFREGLPLGNAQHPTQKFLQVTKLLLAVLAAASSVSLTLLVGHRTQSPVLMAFFAVWVLSPFVALVFANLSSNRWSIIPRTTLQGVTLLLAVGSVAIYANMLSAPPGSKLAFPFLVVPVMSWLVITFVIPLAALLSRRLSRFTFVRWLIKAVAGSVLLCVVGITVLLGLLLLDHNRDTTLPTPTGPFAVGRTTYVWNDPSRGPIGT